MAFWTSAASEPKRQHRFILRLPQLQSTEGGAYAEYLCKSVTKPSYTISETPHQFLGNTYLRYHHQKNNHHHHEL